jgi:hypothetical protein
MPTTTLTKPKRKRKKSRQGYTFPGSPNANSSPIRQVGTGYFSIRSIAIPGTPDVSCVTVVQAVTLMIPDKLADQLTTREVLAGLYGALYVSVPIGTFATQKLAPMRKPSRSPKSAKGVKCRRVPVE